MSRIRIKFSRNEQLKYIGHLDMMRAWHRILRRANVPLAYSEGFNPHPKMVFASPLALGILSTAELLDVYLTNDTLSAVAFSEMVKRELPDGLSILQTAIVPNELPPLPAVVCKAEYLIKAVCDDAEKLVVDIQAVLDADHIDWEQVKKGVVKVYDIREKIFGLSLVSSSNGIVEVSTLLQCDNTGSGRPEQIAKLLKLEEVISITRTRLVMAEPVQEEQEK